MKSYRYSRIFLLLLLLAFAHEGIGPLVAETQTWKKLVTVQSSDLDENSGIAPSNRYSHAIWMHNDSGGKNHCYLVSSKTGETLATVKLDGSTNRDWEDIATFQLEGTTYVMIADVGDNANWRTSYQLCIFPEPELEIDSHEKPKSKKAISVPWFDFRFQYEDGSRNCESVAVDVLKRQIVLVQKVYPEHATAPGIYTLDLPENITVGERQKGIAERRGNLLIKNLTAMDIAQNGQQLVIRNYGKGWIYNRTNGGWAQTLATGKGRAIAFPKQIQGEGTCFTADGRDLLISSEKKKQPLWVLPLNRDW